MNTQEDNYTPNVEAAAHEERERRADPVDRPMRFGPARSVDFMAAFHASRAEVAEIAKRHQSTS